MAENKEDYYSLGDIINHAKAFIRYLLKRWWMLVIAMIIGGTLGIGYYYIQKPKYEATTTFILEEKSAGGGGLASMASQFGFNLGGLSGGGSMFSGDNILSILKSKNIVQKVLLSSVEESNKTDKTLADLYLDFSGLKKSWEIKTQLVNINFSNIKETVTPLQDSVLNVIYETLVKKSLSVERTSKQGSIISVQVTAANSTFARLMCTRLVDEAARLYMEIKTGTAEANINKLQNRSDSLLYLLNRKSYAAAASQPLDINPAIKTAIVPTEIANRDKTVLATLYAEVTKNLEASKLLLSQQTPVIEVLDRPGIQLDDQKKGLAFFLFVGSLVTTFCFGLGAFGTFCLK